MPHTEDACGDGREEKRPAEPEAGSVWEAVCHYNPGDEKGQSRATKIKQKKKNFLHRRIES